jgi:hypothetical protein
LECYFFDRKSSSGFNGVILDLSILKYRFLSVCFYAALGQLGLDASAHLLGSVWLASQTMCKSKAMNEANVAIGKSLKWRRALSSLDA